MKMSEIVYFVVFIVVCAIVSTIVFVMLSIVAERRAERQYSNDPTDFSQRKSRTRINTIYRRCWQRLAIKTGRMCRRMELLMRIVAAVCLVFSFVFLMFGSEHGSMYFLLLAIGAKVGALDQMIGRRER